MNGLVCTLMDRKTVCLTSGLGLSEQICYRLVVGSAYQQCLLGIGCMVFIDHQTACLRSDQNQIASGASLKPT